MFFCGACPSGGIWIGISECSICKECLIQKYNKTNADNLGRVSAFDSEQAWRLIHFVAELLEGSVAIAPVFEHLDIEVQEAFLACEFLDVFAGFDAYFLDGHAFVADKDGFLRLAFDENDCADIVYAFFLLVAFHGDFAAVWDFLLIVEEQLLADDFANEEAHGAVCELVFGEIGRVLGQELHNVVEDGVDIEVLGCRSGYDYGTWDLVVPIGDFVVYHLLVAEVVFGRGVGI